MSDSLRSARILAEVASGRSIGASRSHVLRCWFRLLPALIALCAACSSKAGDWKILGPAPEPIDAQLGEAQGALAGDRAAYQHAFELLANGHAVDALAEADAAVLKNPKSSDLYNVRGMAADQIGRTQEAEASFRK